VQDTKRERRAIVLPVSRARRAWALACDTQQVRAQVRRLIDAGPDGLFKRVSKRERPAFEGLRDAVAHEHPQVTGVQIDGTRFVPGSRPQTERQPGRLERDGRRLSNQQPRRTALTNMILAGARSKRARMAVA
jgi:hypothetical protein